MMCSSKSFRVLPYGSETLILTSKSSKHLQTTQRNMERSMLDLTLSNRVRHGEILRSLNVDGQEMLQDWKMGIGRKGSLNGDERVTVLRDCIPIVDQMTSKEYRQTVLQQHKTGTDGKTFRRHMCSSGHKKRSSSNGFYRKSKLQ